MGVHTLLQRRRYSYFIRKRVPADLVPVIGKREIIKSLNTLNPEEAKTKAKLMGLEVDRLLEAARNGISLTLQDAETLAQRWKADALTVDAEDRAARQRQTFEDMEQEEETVSMLATDQRERLALRNATAADKERARKLLAEQGLAISEDSPAFRTMLFAVMKAHAEVLEAIARRSAGDLSEPAQATAAAPAVAPVLSPLASQVSRLGRPAGVNNLRLSAVLDRYLAERKPGPKTVAEWRTAIRRFGEVSGEDLPVRNITKAHVREFKDTLLQMPARVPRELVKLTVPEVLAKVANKPEMARLSTTAVAKAITALGSVMSWALKNDYCDINPTVGLKPADPQADAEKRLPYDTADLKRIFASPIYTSAPADPRERGHDFWLPLLGIFSGCRLEEIGQALVSDVREEDGSPYLDINTVEEGKRAKTKGSRRKVPVHPELIRCGFLDYVAGLRERGEQRMFPGLNLDSQQTWTGAWSKKWGRYARGIGITDKRKVFHSTRHSFKDACRRAGIEEAISDAFTGHSNGSVGRRYGSGYPVSVLAQNMERVSYPGLDLGSFHPGPVRG